MSETSATGAQSQKTYDFLGRDATSTQLERYSGGSGTTAYTTNFSYGTGGWLATSQTPDGALTSRVYDAAGELTSVTDPAGNVTKYAYDDFGRQTGTTNPDSTSTTNAYDASGDVTSTSDLDSTGKTLSTTSSTYDGDGNELSSTDAMGNTSTFTYDPTGSVTQEVQPVSSSSGITTSFGYDAAGNETRYTDGNGDNWYYTYNSWGLPETRVEPTTSAYGSAANSTYTMAYDANARAVSETEPGGVAIADSYNNSGELTGESGNRGGRGDGDADTGVRPGRAAHVGDHVEHGGRIEPVERHQRVVHLQRPGPGADLLRHGGIDGLRLQRRRPGHLGRGRGRDHVVRLRLGRPTADAERPGVRHDGDVQLQQRQHGQPDQLRQRRQDPGGTTRCTG